MSDGACKEIPKVDKRSQPVFFGTDACEIYLTHGSVHRDLPLIRDRAFELLNSYGYSDDEIYKALIDRSKPKLTKAKIKAELETNKHGKATSALFAQAQSAYIDNFLGFLGPEKAVAKAVEMYPNWFKKERGGERRLRGVADTTFLAILRMDEVIEKRLTLNKPEPVKRKTRAERAASSLAGALGSASSSDRIEKGAAEYEAEVRRRAQKAKTQQGELQQPSPQGGVAAGGTAHENAREFMATILALQKASQQHAKQQASFIATEINKWVAALGSQRRVSRDAALQAVLRMGGRGAYDDLSEDMAHALHEEEIRAGDSVLSGKMYGPLPDAEFASLKQQLGMQRDNSKFRWMLPPQYYIGRGYGLVRAKLKTRHKGIDVSAPAETPIFAVKKGRVRAVDVRKGYGVLVVVDHIGPNGERQQVNIGHCNPRTLAHAQALIGKTVNPGDVIGWVGMTTGKDTTGKIITGVGPHVHFELRTEGPEGYRTYDPVADSRLGNSKGITDPRTLPHNFFGQNLPARRCVGFTYKKHCDNRSYAQQRAAHGRGQ